LYAWASEARLNRLDNCGMIRLIVRKRKGQIARAILHTRVDDAKPVMSVPDGTRYSYREKLAHGVAWTLRHITHLPNEDFVAVTAKPAGPQMGE